MITEDYVSFEISKILKEKGFDCGCDTYYTKTGSVAYTQLRYNHNEIKNRYSRPTLQMAMKWLRERKIYIMIDRSWSMADSWQYCICVNNDFDNLIQQTSVPNRTYEEAVEAALKYSLENLI
jgi:hypothetical protein